MEGLACASVSLRLIITVSRTSLQAVKGRVAVLARIVYRQLFTTLHGMQTRSSDENSVCLSVCLSVTRVYCDKTVERSVQIYIPFERTFSLVFWEEEWLVGGDPFYVKIWLPWSEIADFQPIIARSSSAVTPSEKSSINALSNEPKMIVVSCPKSPKGVSKTQNGRCR